MFSRPKTFSHKEDFRMRINPDIGKRLAGLADQPVRQTPLRGGQRLRQRKPRLCAILIHKMNGIPFK
jgi:hypothetical protein